MANKTKRGSQKGQRGTTVGAPPKPVNWPSGAFTIKTLVGRNQRQCELSLRNKVNASLESGEIVELEGIKQPGGKVGRPKSRYVLKANFDATAMKQKNITLTPVVAVSAPAVAPSQLVVPAPCVAPPSPQIAVPASPAPETAETASTTEATPVPSEPVIG